MTTPTTPPDLAARLDRAVGDPPPATPAPDPRVAGQRVLRGRRTTAAGLVAAAAVVVVAVVGPLAGQPTADRRGPEVADGSPSAVATTPTATPPTTPIPVATSTAMTGLLVVLPADAERADGTYFASLSTDGLVALVPGVTVLDRIDDPVTGAGHSVALQVSRTDETGSWFVLLTTTRGVRRRPQGLAYRREPGDDTYASLQAWVTSRDVTSTLDQAPLR